MAKYNYFDKRYFGKCLSAAIKKRYSTVSAFAFYNFRDKTGKTVYKWTIGETMPDVDCMKRLAFIFGQDEVKSWLKFSF